MIKNITLDNFQSHSNTFIEFGPTVNTIIGLSDSGKSGIIRAIKANVKRDPFYIKVGEFSGEVTIEFTDYHISRKVESGKIKKCPSCKRDVTDFEKAYLCECGNYVEPSIKADFYYEKDGKTYEKFGVNLPDFILDKTRIRNISFVDFEEDLNIFNQHDDMFFVGKSYSGLRRNKILSSLIPDSEKIDLLIKNISSENSKDKQLFDIAQSTIQDLEPKINEAKPIVEEYKKIQEEITREQGELADLTSDIMILNRYIQTVKLDEKKFAIKDKITPIANYILAITGIVNELEAVESSHSQLSNISNFLEVNKNKFNVKIDNIDIPTIEDLSSLEIDIINLKSIFKSYEETSANNSELTILMDNVNIAIADTNEKFEEFIEKEAICPIIKDKYCDKCKIILRG